MARSFRRGPGLAGMWFPAALLVLLLLALPGAVFLALHLFGKESTLNGWLKDHFGVTYHLATPWWTGVALLLVPLLLILLYFLKLKRKPLQVPSTFLWRKSIEDLHVNSLFQWLRDNVLLLVQLLIVLLLIYSVLSLQVHGNTSAGKHYILLIDNSASMAVADVGKSRLEAAKDEALREIDGHSRGRHGHGHRLQFAGVDLAAVHQRSRSAARGRGEDHANAAADAHRRGAAVGRQSRQSAALDR